jgi:hypothetical protein
MMDSTGVFAASFGVSGFAGLAALLRSGNQLTSKSVISAGLNSGLLGLGVCLVWYHQYVNDVHMLLGLCLLSGLGGMTTVDFVTDFVRRAITGFSIGNGKGKSNG